MKRTPIVFAACLVILSGCHHSSTNQASARDDSSKSKQARDDEVMRLNTLPETTGNYIQFLHEGSTLIVNEPGYSFFETKDALVCSLSQVEFRQSIFSNVRVVKGHPPDMTTVLEIALPVTTGVPADCDLPPGTHGMR